ncbi:MAG: hypothetical protein JWP97_4398 [Labilithrix sp.]|nr:hypothetical protein [Labilithrix sp.]
MTQRGFALGARRLLRHAAIAAVVGAACAAGVAGCKPPYCTFRGTLNEPSSLSMRKSLLRKGMGDFCTQMLSRNAPLRLSPESPVIGRFYPQQCASPESDGDLNVSFAGFGYAYTNLSKKVTFNASAAALYRYDFMVTEGERCDLYAYFRPSRVDQQSFTMHRIESGAASFLNQLTSVADGFGKQLVGKKLGEGFTVIHYTENNVDEFGLGIIALGKKPFHPYQVHGTDRITYENERTEVHQNQRDFVGPIKVEDSGRSIFVTAQLDGAPAIDVMVMRKAEGDASLQLYYEYPASGPLAGPPIAGDVLQQGLEVMRAVPVPPGMYYVVFDNTSTAGQVAPPGNALDDRAAVVNYLIQIGDSQ